MLIPAINGTTNALKAIVKYGPQIKHVVVTSSVVAVGKYGKYAGANDKFNETDWNPIDYETSKKNPFYGYFGSKKFAEKSAWEFINTENQILNYRRLILLWFWDHKLSLLLQQEN